MKQFLIVVLMLVAFNALLVFSGALDKLLTVNQDTAPTTVVDQTIVDVFQFTLQDEVDKKLGHPIEGYEPQMFLQVFPGLVETDFNGVEASLGYYRIQNGKLQHEMSDTGLVHSAAGAVTRKGMKTLLNNIAARAEINLAESGTLTDIIEVLTKN